VRAGHAPILIITSPLLTLKNVSNCVHSVDARAITSSEMIDRAHEACQQIRSLTCACVQ